MLIQFLLAERMSKHKSCLDGFCIFFPLYYYAESKRNVFVWDKNFFRLNELTTPQNILVIEKTVLADRRLKVRRLTVMSNSLVTCT